MRIKTNNVALTNKCHLYKVQPAILSIVLGLIVLLILSVMAGCAKPHALSAGDKARIAGREAGDAKERTRLQGLFGLYREDLAKASAKAASTKGEAYILVKIVDRNFRFQDHSATRVLILYKENADPDDYSIIPTGKETAPDAQSVGIQAEFFWTNTSGDILAPSYDALPKDSFVVQEWYVPNKYSDVSLVYDVQPLLKLRFAQ